MQSQTNPAEGRRGGVSHKQVPPALLGGEKSVAFFKNCFAPSVNGISKGTSTSDFPLRVQKLSQNVWRNGFVCAQWGRRSPLTPAFQSAYFAVPVRAHWLSFPLSCDIASFLCFSTNKASASLLRNLAQGLEIPENAVLSLLPFLSFSLSHTHTHAHTLWCQLGEIITLHPCESKSCPHLLRKVFPKGLSLRKGLLGSTMRALPGMTLSTSPCMMAVKQSVVGSGPTLLPGMSCSSRYLSHTQRFVFVFSICSGIRGDVDLKSYLMKVVFPVEYCPTTNTIGLLSKSASSRLGEWKSWKP